MAAARVHISTLRKDGFFLGLEADMVGDRAGLQRSAAHVPGACGKVDSRGFSNHHDGEGKNEAKEADVCELLNQLTRSL